MAKKEIKYVCEVCGEKYLKEEVAVNCEKQHYKPVEITGFNYDKNEQKREYPSTITVKLVNGEGKEKIVTFSRK